jgi:hypothetical protein
MRPATPSTLRLKDGAAATKVDIAGRSQGVLSG